MLSQNLKSLIKTLPIVKQYIDKKNTLIHQYEQEISQLCHQQENLTAEILELKQSLSKSPSLWVPPGHFYSPIPSVDEIKRQSEKIFHDAVDPALLLGINLNEAAQLSLLQVFKPFYHELPFKSERQDNCRYFFDNPNYSYSDAIFLYFIMRYAQPKRIIEVGSGFSSCLILDTNEIFYENKISCTFIEPYPELLFSLLKNNDGSTVDIVSKKIQDVPIDIFLELEENDILFIDSTHVSKTASDVNWILFEILPRLKTGVYIHFHDIFYPFEYPQDWVYEGRSWNEAYILRAFLQFNREFEIQLMNTFLETLYEDWFRKEMPLCLENRGGSLWLKKVELCP